MKKTHTFLLASLFPAMMIPAFIACSPDNKTVDKPDDPATTGNDPDDQTDSTAVDSTAVDTTVVEPPAPIPTPEGLIALMGSKPNILILMCDQLRWDAINCMHEANNVNNGGIYTPNFDRLAASGVLFTHALTPCPVSVPARTSILTGTFIEKTKILANTDVKDSEGGDGGDSGDDGTGTTGNKQVPPGYLSYDQILVQNGYTAEYYGKFHSCSDLAKIYSNPIPSGWGVRDLSGVGSDMATLQTSFEQIYLEWLNENAAALWPIHFNFNGPQYKNGPYGPYLAQYIPLAQSTVPGVSDVAPGQKTWQQYDGSDIKYWPSPMDQRYTYAAQDDKPANRLWDGNDKKASVNRMSGHSLMPLQFTTTGFHARNVMAALDRLKGQQFSLMCSFQSPHPPVIPSEDFVKEYYDQLSVKDNGKMGQLRQPVSMLDLASVYPNQYKNNTDHPDYINWSKLKYCTSDYYATIEEVDYYIGKILDKLDQTGQRANTCIFFISDHGEMLGSHGLKGKGVLMEEAIRVPMIMSWPAGGIPQGVRIDAPVSELNLFPTIMYLLGDTVSMKNCDGYSLLPMAFGEQPQQDFAISEWQSIATAVPNMCITTKDWKVMFNYTKPATDAVYNLATDPYEMNNLIGTTQGKDMATQLRNKALPLLESRGHPWAPQIKARKF